MYNIWGKLLFSDFKLFGLVTAYGGAVEADAQLLAPFNQPLLKFLRLHVRKEIVNVLQENLAFLSDLVDNHQADAAVILKDDWLAGGGGGYVFHKGGGIAGTLPRKNQGCVDIFDRGGGSGGGILCLFLLLLLLPGRMRLPFM